MEWFEALILGVLQGLTEYLPVSSSVVIWLSVRHCLAYKGKII